MKNIILIHGYNGIPKIYTWLEENLTKKGFNVVIPNLPPREGAIYNDWKNIISRYNDFFNEETIIIGHSIGNGCLIKYLVEYNIKVNLYIGLAGFDKYFEHDGRDDLNRAVKEFIANNEEIEKFKFLTNYRYDIYSDNDHIVPYEILKNYPLDINAKEIFIKGIGHMGKKSGLEEIPEVIDIIEKYN